MMGKYLIGIFILVSCSNKRFKENKIMSVSNDTVKNNNMGNLATPDSCLISIADTVRCDTIITYDLEGVSSEGGEVEACYYKNKIQKSTLIIYGSSGKEEIFYKFKDGHIQVEERVFKYLKALSEVQNQNDLKLEHINKYILSIKGKMITGSCVDGENIYKLFSQVVPLHLR